MQSRFWSPPEGGEAGPSAFLRRLHRRLHAFIAVGVASLYGCMVLATILPGWVRVALIAASLASIGASIVHMQWIAGGRDVADGVRRYTFTYVHARLGVPHALATTLLAVCVSLACYLLLDTQSPWADGIVEGLRLANVVLVGLTTWRLHRSFWWAPVAGLIASDLALFAAMRGAREIDPLFSLAGAVAGIYVLLQAQHLVDRIIGLRRLHA